MKEHTPAFTDGKVGNRKTKGAPEQGETIPTVLFALRVFLMMAGQKSHDTPLPLVNLGRTQGAWMDPFQQKPVQRGASISGGKVGGKVGGNGAGGPGSTGLEEAFVSAVEHSQREQWRVGGMHCAGCAARLEGVLQGVPGVGEASVNYATGVATVRWRQTTSGAERRGPSQESRVDGAQNGEVRAASLVAAIEEAGFTAEAYHPVKDLTGGHEEAVQLALLRFLCAALFFVPLFVGTMGAHFWPRSLLAAQFYGRTLLEALLSGAAVFWAAASVLRSACGAVLRRAPDMDFLVGTGGVLAWGGSLYAWLSGEMGEAGHGGGYFEVAAGIVTFALFGRWLELRNRLKAGEAIRGLAQMQPGTVRLVVLDGVREVPLAEVKSGDVVLVEPGERVAVDGVVLEGYSNVDEAWVTGESVPVARGPGDPVTGGTINGDGSLRVRVSAAGRDAFLQQVLRIVQEAQGSKPPVQRLADRVAGRFALGVFLVALGTALCWGLVSPEGQRVHAAFWHGLTVLVVACPCALGLATPVAVLAGTGRAAREGVLFRGGAALERLSKLRTVVFDKTGTLTQGRLEVAEWWESRSFEGRLLEMVAAAEQHSAHPAGAAVVRAATVGKASLPAARSVSAIPGRGIRAEVEGVRLLVGTHELLEEEGVGLPPDPNDGRVWIAADGLFSGWFLLEDRVRPEAQEVVAELRKRGVESVLLSGDQKLVAERIAAKTGIEKCFAGARPDAKRRIVAELQAGGVTAMVGDGVNDAPALAQADIGIAMGGGTAVARQTSDVTLIRDDLRLLLMAMDLSRKTLSIIRQNLFFAFGYNVLAIPLAAGLLEAWDGWAPGPLAASAAMALSSVSVVCNALRLRNGALR
jgi:Cu+-exporting ATPase